MKRNHFFIIFFLGILSVIVYHPIFRMFFLQEEWLTLGHILVEGVKHPFAGVNFMQFILGEDRSLARVLGMVFFGYFRLNTTPVAIFSLTLHVANSYLIFLLGKKFTRNDLAALLASIIFLVSSVSSSAVFWFGTSIGTLPATTLVLLATFTYFDFLEMKKSKDLVLTFLLLYISLFFKEVGVYLFVLFPLTSLLFKRARLIRYLRVWWPFLLFSLIYLGFRIFELKFTQSQQALFLTGSSESFIPTLVVRMILYPLTSFSLQFVPQETFLYLGRVFTNLYYPFFSPQEFNLIVQTAVLDIFAVVLSFVIFSLIYFWGRTLKILDKNYLIFTVLFSLLSFLPYIVISKNFSYLESRYYYLSLATGSIILAWLVVSPFSERIRPVKVGVLITILIFLGWHTLILSRDLSEEAKISDDRRNLISQIKKLKPTLSENKNILYITSDQDFYTPNNKLPFQQGVGYMLMVLYYGSGKIPKELLEKDYLFVLGSQGYKEVNGSGFGYFSDETAMEIQLKRYKIPPSSIFRFYYDSKNGKLTEINDVYIR